MVKFIDNNKGYALVMIIIIMAIMMVLGTTIMNVALAENNFAVRQENELKAYYIARAGAQSIAEYMIQDPNGDAENMLDKVSGWNEQIGDGRFKVSVQDDTGNNVINIISTGEYKSHSQEAIIRITTSSDDVGGIFDHAIVAQNNIDTSNSAGLGITITGSVATKKGTIDLGSKGTADDYDEGNESLIFPAIVLPPDKDPAIPYDDVLGNVDLDNGSTSPIINSTYDIPVYISTGNITIKKNEIIITGDGIVHMYVEGDIDMDTQSKFTVSNDAKLYIYVVGERTVKFTGNGNQHNLLLYAPDSDIFWNNAGSGDFVGGIIGNNVTLANQTVVEHDPEMVNGIDINTENLGITYTGYTWIN